MVIGWGVIGCSSMADNRTVPAIREAENSRLVAVMSRSIKKAEAFATKHGAERYYDKVDLLLKDDGVDAVYVSTPTFLHAPQTILAAEAGKHVLCEKPMALNLKECLRMVEACKKASVKLMIGHHMRFKPDHVKVRRMIAHGVIGDVILARAQLSIWYRPDSATWRMKPSLGGGGALMDLGVHCIDLLRFLVQSEVEEVSAYARSVAFDYPVEDTAVVLMRFKNNTCGIVDSCFNIRYSEKVLEIYGTQGTLLGVGTIGPKSGVVRAFIDERKVTYEFEEKNPYIAEVTHFAECIETDKEPLISGEKCLGTMKAIFGAYQSSKTKEIVRL